jgi:hypothetical protein
VVCELGDVSRLHASRQAVRIAGIDIGVHRSDRHARLGKLTRQGSPELRWALYEAAQSACRPTSPDYQDHHALKQRGLSHTRASLTIARKLARRSYHVLRELGPAALAPITTEPPTRSDQAHTSTMRPTQLPAGSRSGRDTHDPVATHQRPSGRSRSARNDRSTISTPAANPDGRGPRQGRASPEQTPIPHVPPVIHDPAGDPLTQTPPPPQAHTTGGLDTQPSSDKQPPRGRELPGARRPVSDNRSHAGDRADRPTARGRRRVSSRG